jgi:pimeloyl-ACP methyl ester carboxylesterase
VEQTSPERSWAARSRLRTWPSSSRLRGSARFDTTSEPTQHRSMAVAHAAEATIDFEVVEDACAAIQLARSLQDVNGSRIFVQGHSLGGMLALRIAQRCEPVAGLILLAAPPVLPHHGGVAMRRSGGSRRRPRNNDETPRPHSCVLVRIPVLHRSRDWAKPQACRLFLRRRRAKQRDAGAKYSPPAYCRSRMGHGARWRLERRHPGSRALRLAAAGRAG